MTQAEDRAHRIGQQNCVNIYYLHGPETVDDLILDLLREKSYVVSGAIDGQRPDYKINATEKEEIIENVKELKSKGTLNPVIVNKKKVNKIEDFFKKGEII